MLDRECPDEVELAARLVLAEREVVPEALEAPEALEVEVSRATATLEVEVLRAPEAPGVLEASVVL